MPGQVRDEDYDNWLECPTCGWLYPIYQVDKEATIKDSIETIESPFESGKFHKTIPKRNSPAVKRASAKRRRNKIRTTNDKDINLAIQQHGEDNVRIIQDTNP